MQPERVKGTRDFPPEEMKLREKVVSTIKKVYEKRGFVELQTPAIEKWETLSAKNAGGEELLNETFNWMDQGERRIGLRYDLTVPMIRYIAMNPNLSLPFKRYQYGPVWRYEKIREGRYREFYQFDIDVIGSSSMLADAECISAACEALESVGIKDFIVKINNRKIVESLLKALGIKQKEQLEGAMRTIDKMQKLPETELAKEFAEYRITKQTADEIIRILNKRGKAEILIDRLKLQQETLGIKLDGIAELEQLISYLREFGCISKIEIDLSIVRGIAYYTGVVYETYVKKNENLGSICSGGRYDNLLNEFLGKQIPATGISIGIERILDILRETEKVDFGIDYFIAVVNQDEKSIGAGIKILNQLRAQNLSAEIDLMGRSFNSQMKYADKINANKVVIVGPKELEEGKVIVKDMKTGKEEKRAIGAI